MVHDLLSLTWEELSRFPSGRLAVFAGIAPVEEHGRHLPLGVDLFETRKWMEDSACLLSASLDGFHVCLLPVIPLGYAGMGDFPGNLHVSRQLVFQTVYEVLTAVSGWGAENIIVLSGHADPLHTIAVEQACEKINREKGIIAFTPMGTIFNLEEKGIETQQPPQLRHMEAQYPNDFHAGWIETSSMLDIAPELVKSNYRERPDISLTGRGMADAGKTAQAILGEGHAGFPKAAGRTLGKALNSHMALEITRAALNFIQRSGYECYMKHPLYDVPGFQIREPRQ